MKQKLSHLAFTDIETTGLNRAKHEIIEVALFIVNQPEFEIIETWQAKIKPLHPENIDPIARKMVGYSAKDWKDSLHPKIAFEEYSKKTRDCHLVAHNIYFDRSFLEDNFRKWKVPVLWHYHSLDTVSLAYYKLGPNISFKLSELAKYFGIKQEKHHSAYDDTRVCYEIFKKLVQK